MVGFGIVAVVYYVIALIATRSPKTAPHAKLLVTALLVTGCQLTIGNAKFVGFVVSSAVAGLVGVLLLKLWCKLSLATSVATAVAFFVAVAALSYLLFHDPSFNMSRLLLWRPGR